MQNSQYKIGYRLWEPNDLEVLDCAGGRHGFVAPAIIAQIKHLKFLLLEQPFDN
jgi:hypothetical protein